MMDYRKRLKAEGWRQLSILMPPDELMSSRLLNYKWLLLNEYRQKQKDCHD